MAEDSSSKRTRASGEVLDYLLREFEQNHNPSPEQRKEISERTSMTEKAVRIWFQNRRAKLRKFERMGKPVKSGLSSPHNGHTNNTRSYPPTGSDHSLRSNLLTHVSATGLRMQSAIPIELNDKYCFIDCLSLSVGSWQRIISGHHDMAALQHLLINLSPFTLNTVMNNVDLMVILSRKNLEINYFFSAISNNSKILFRIFYPISSVLSCLLLDNNINKENNELRLSLLRKPKFSVYFFNGVNANLNQWLICDDFSEGQQVSLAYYAPGGSLTPHVLVGVKSSLQYLNAYIMENSHQQHQQQQHQHLHLHLLYANLSANISSTNTPRDFPSVSSDLPVGQLPESKDFMLDEETHPNGNFQIKHETWADSPRLDLGYRMKELSPLPAFDSTSPHIETQKNYNVKPDLADAKKPEDYDEMFGTATPDFFSTVQTPSSNMLGTAATEESENLINSPSTNIHNFGNPAILDKRQSPRSGTPVLESRFRQEQELQFDNLGEPQIYSAAQENGYEFDIGQESGNFPAENESPHASNNTATPNTNNLISHVDNFIDYNAHY